MTNVRLHILVVDDQPDNRLILDNLLGEHYAVQTSATGEEALAYLDNAQADLILLDIRDHKGTPKGHKGTPTLF